MKDMPLNALRALALVHERGGVRAAARELGIAHSAVSRHLRLLEAWVGAALFEPHYAKRFEFTAQGKALATVAHQALQEIANAAAALREARGSGSVTIATTPSFAVRWLFPRLANLALRYPHVELSVIAEQRVADVGD